MVAFSLRGQFYIFSEKDFLSQKRKNQGRTLSFCTSGTSFLACLPYVVTWLLCSDENFGASLPKVLNVQGKWIAKTLYEGGGRKEGK